MSSLQFYEYGVSKGGVSYAGNFGRQPATPTPNTPEPPPYTLYNNLASRGAQAAAGFYANNNGMTMSPDGTKIYAVNHNGVSEGFTNDAVSQYTLTTPWDLSTMTGVVGSTISLNSFPSFTDGGPLAAFFSPDGFNLYVSGGGSNRVFRFTLATAYMVATSTPHSSFATGLTGLFGLSFSQDGTKMFVTNSGFIRRFTLSVAWDITTATNDAMSLAILGGQIFFKTDGLSFFTFSGPINRYYLTTPWDLSTHIATTSSVALSTLTGVFQGGIYISPDGKYYFMSGYTGYPVKRFELKAPFKAAK